MCTGLEGALVSGALGLGGAALQNKAAEDAAERQQAILAAGEEENQRVNARGEQAVNDFARKTFTPEAREKSYEAAANERETSLAEALSKAASPTQTASGAVSSDYLSGAATSNANQQADAAKRAKLVARAGAGSLMLGNESLRGGGLASDLAGLSQESRRNANYTKNAAGSVRNKGSLVGGLLSGLGSAGMMGA